MLGSITNNPSSATYQLSVGDYELVAAVAKKAKEHLLKENQEFVDNFASKFFIEVIAEGGLIGPDGKPAKLSSEEMEVWLVEFKKDFLNDLMQADAARLKESAEKRFTEAARLKESSQQHLSDAARLKESAEKHFAEAERWKTQAEKEGLDALTKQFWSIFNGKDPIPQERYSEVFNTYLADRSLTVEETVDGKAFGRINSMNSVIKYLQANPLTKTCDFRHFKTEVNDVETLAEFLQTPAAYAIKGVAFKKGISEIAKNQLAAAASARASTNFPLKVQYFN